MKLSHYKSETLLHLKLTPVLLTSIKMNYSSLNDTDELIMPETIVADQSPLSKEGNLVASINNSKILFRRSVKISSV